VSAASSSSRSVTSWARRWRRSSPSAGRAQRQLALGARHFSPSRVFHASHALAPPLSATRAADAQRVLRACGLAQLALDAPLRSLSGGQQRRLALAVQLLRRPPLLLLDEPLAGLDWRARVALLPLLCAVARSCCVLAVTHDTQLLKPRATAGRWRMHAGGLQREEDACADC